MFLFWKLKNYYFVRRCSWFWASKSCSGSRSSQSIVIPGFFNATEQKHFNKVKYFWPEVIYVFLRLSSFVFFKISNFAKREKRKNLMCFFRQNMLAVKAEEMLHSVNALWLTFLCPQKCIKISHSLFFIHLLLHCLDVHFLR